MVMLFSISFVPLNLSVLKFYAENLGKKEYSKYANANKLVTITMLLDISLNSKSGALPPFILKYVVLT